MPVKLSQFQQKSTIDASDFLVGYTNTAAGGERRWNLQNLINVAGAETPAGTPVQTVQTVQPYVVYRQGDTNNNWLDVTGMSRTIRAKTADPTIRVQAMINCSSNNGAHGPMFRLQRVNQNTLSETIVGIPPIATVGTSTNITRCTAGEYGGPLYNSENVCIDFVDNSIANCPAGTLLNYKLQWWAWAATYVYLNCGYGGLQNHMYRSCTISTVTLTEIVK